MNFSSFGLGKRQTYSQFRQRCDARCQEAVAHIARICPDKRDLIAALNRADIVPMDDFAFNNLYGVKALAAHTFKLPHRSLITLRDKLAADPSGLCLLVDILAHEGEHGVHAKRQPHLFASGAWANYSPSRYGPASREDWVEKPAYVKGTDVALRVAAAVVKERHRGKLVPLADMPEGRTWIKYVPRIAPVLGEFDRTFAETGDETRARRAALGVVIVYFNRIQAPYYRERYDSYRSNRRPVRYDSAGPI